MSEVESINNNKKKTPLEIRQVIEQALVKNEIIGHLINNFLYMQSYGRNSSPDKIVMGIGAFLLLFGLPGRNSNSISELEIILIISGIALLILGFIISKLLRYYLVYDIDKEVFYTITNFKNHTLSKSKEISRKDIVELGIDVLDKNEKGQVYSQIINHKGDLRDNNLLRTSFVALKSNGKRINISDPVALRGPREAAIARCKLFSECFGVDSVICELNEGLRIVKGQQIKFEKYSKEPEWEKARKGEKRAVWIVLGIFLLVFGIIAFLVLSH